jgi:hypothetical protein
MSATLTESQDPRAEALFASWNLGFELTEFGTDEIRTLDGAQVRDLGNIAPDEGIEEYRTQMHGGARFPAIVLMKPNILLDGNTRLGAATAEHLGTFPAYVVDVPTVDLGRALAATLNQRNGRRLTAEEAQRSALSMIQNLHFNDDQVAANIGRSGQQVRTWRRQVETETRAKRLGLADEVAKVSLNQRDRIASVSHDAPFAELVKLASEVKIPPSDLRRIVNDITKAPSEADEIQRVTQARDELRPAGPPPRRPQRNEVAARARMVVPQVINLTESPLALLEPGRLEEDRKMWATLRERVEAVVAFFNEQPEPML